VTTVAIGIDSILDAVISHAAASGWFEQVNGGEPISPATSGLTAAVWVDTLTPIRSSGLASASARLGLITRLFTSAEQLPTEGIDPNMTLATDALMRAYVGDFELGGADNVRFVDVFGAHGPALDARAGYLPVSGVTLRVMTISLPVIVNDLWDEAP
jgi:hypothetical protein